MSRRAYPRILQFAHLSSSTRQQTLPPSAPISERPGYDVLYTSFDALSSHVLFAIFDHFRLDAGESWNLQLTWFKLSHVCRKWRHIIHRSSSRLDLHIPFTNGTLPLDMLSHLPPLPMIIHHRSKDEAEDDSDPGVSHTIQKRDRICRIGLQVPGLLQAVDQLTVPTDESLPVLESLSPSSSASSKKGTKLTFRTPTLLRLTSHGTCLPKVIPLLTSAFSLITLNLATAQPHGHLTLENLLKKLECASLVEELLIVSNFPVSKPLLNPWPLFPIYMANPEAESTREDWRDLLCARLGNNNYDLYIFARYQTQMAAGDSASNQKHSSRILRIDSLPTLTKVLPPSAPTSERPEYDVLYTTADMLNGDVLLAIFHHYQLHNEGDWNRKFRWCKLSHVCRKWRYLIHQSSFHLNMHIVFTNGTPPLDLMAHLPPLPLVIDYHGGDADDDRGIIHAVQHRDRVLRIASQAPLYHLDRLVVSMDGSFPRLEFLSLSLKDKPEEGTRLMLPSTFLAPNLRHLSLHGICLPKDLPLLASAFSLITLKLTGIPSHGYFSPQTLVTQLHHVPQLEGLSIAFSTPLPRPSTEGELLREPMTHTALPALRWLEFRGVSAYLEGLIARITVPLLERINITLFNQLTFTLPHLSNVIRTTETLRHSLAAVAFNRVGVSFVVGSRDQSGEGTFSLNISCKHFDWQIGSATQICGTLLPVLSAAEELTLEFEEENLPTDWQNAVDAIVWHGILWPFTSVRKLRIGHPLASELSSALESDDAGLILELLPELQVLEAQVESGNLNNAFATFVDARLFAGRPVNLLVSPVVISRAVPTQSAPPENEPPAPPQSIPDENEPPAQFQSTPNEDELPVLLPAAVQKNWFRRALVEPVRRRLRSRARTGSTP